MQVKVNYNVKLYTNGCTIMYILSTGCGNFGGWDKLVRSVVVAFHETLAFHEYETLLFVSSAVFWVINIWVQKLVFLSFLLYMSECVSKIHVTESVWEMVACLKTVQRVVVTFHETLAFHEYETLLFVSSAVFWVINIWVQKLLFLSF